VFDDEYFYTIVYTYIRYPRAMRAVSNNIISEIHTTQRKPDSEVRYSLRQINSYGETKPASVPGSLKFANSLHTTIQLAHRIFASSGYFAVRTPYAISLYQVGSTSHCNSLWAHSYPKHVSEQPLAIFIPCVSCAVHTYPVYSVSFSHFALADEEVHSHTESCSRLT
jgi:hypothetical protein